MFDRSEVWTISLPGGLVLEYFEREPSKQWVEKFALLWGSEVEVAQWVRRSGSGSTGSGSRPAPGRAGPVTGPGYGSSLVKSVTQKGNAGRRIGSGSRPAGGLGSPQDLKTGRSGAKSGKKDPGQAPGPGRPGRALFRGSYRQKRRWDPVKRLPGQLSPEMAGTPAV